MDLHEICDSRDIDFRVITVQTPFVFKCVLHVQPLDVVTMKLCASAPMAHEVRHSSDTISWSGVQGPT